MVVVVKQLVRRGLIVLTVIADAKWRSLRTRHLHRASLAYSVNQRFLTSTNYGVILVLVHRTSCLDNDE